MPITTFFLILIFSDNGLVFATSFLVYFLGLAYFINESFKNKVLYGIKESPFRKHILTVQTFVLISLATISAWSFIIASYYVGILVVGAMILWYTAQRSMKKELNIESHHFINDGKSRKLL